MHGASATSKPLDGLIARFVAPRLRTEGFKRKSRSFFKPVGDLFHYVWIQSSRWNPTYETSFAANLRVVWTRWHEVFTGKPISANPSLTLRLAEALDFGGPHIAVQRRCLLFALLIAAANACGDVRSNSPSVRGGSGDATAASPPELTPPAASPALTGTEVSPVATPPDTTFLVFGFVRPDGVIEPKLVRRHAGWSEVVTMDAGPPVPDPGIWAQATNYLTRDSLGAESALSAGRPVRICCSTNGNEFWAHSTDRSGDVVERYSFGGRGYAFSSPIPNAAFLQTSSLRRVAAVDSVMHESLSPTARRPTLDHILTLLDSLAPIPASVLPLPDSVAPIVEVDVWEAGLEGQWHAYVQVTQIRRWQQYDWCLRIVGWLDASEPPRVHVTSSGSDDCDGKGHGTHRPVTLFRQGDGTYMVLTIQQYSDTPIQVWRHRSGAEWLPVPLSTVAN